MRGNLESLILIGGDKESYKWNGQNQGRNDDGRRTNMGGMD